jgi:hypothetical protein
MPLNLSGGGSSISDCDPSKGQSRAKGKGKGKGQGKKGSSGPKVVTLDMEVPSNPTVQAQLVAELTNSPSISRVDLQSDRILLELEDTAGSLDWRLRQELKEVAHNIVADELSHEKLWIKMTEGSSDCGEGVPIPMVSTAAVCSRAQS